MTLTHDVRSVLDNLLRHSAFFVGGMGSASLIHRDAMSRRDFPEAPQESRTCGSHVDGLKPKRLPDACLEQTALGVAAGHPQRWVDGLALDGGT